MSLETPGPLPETLTAWIRSNLPAAGNPATIRFRPCPRVPGWWIPGNKDIAAVVLWNTVYFRDSCWPIDPQSPRSIELLFHELVHVAQFRRHPFLFPIKYLLDHLRYGYRDNPAEVEARERASQLTGNYFNQRSSL